MGRIKPKLIKRTTRALLSQENKFSSNFEENKKRLADTMPSKKVRNKIAGYLVRLKEREISNKIK